MRGAFPPPIFSDLLSPSFTLTSARLPVLNPLRSCDGVFRTVRRFRTVRVFRTAQGFRTGSVSARSVFGPEFALRS